jgi:uncharacterized protein (DUF58 family)
MGADIVFVLDVSENMLGADSFIARGARLATRELRSNDRVAVMSFSSGVKVHLPFTSDKEKLDDAFRKATRTSFRWTGARRMYDAVLTAINQFPIGSSTRGNKVIAVITNDVDSGSAHRPDELVHEAAARGVSIWAFLIANPYADPTHVQNGYPRIPYPDVQFAADELRTITDRTGGKVSIHDTNGYILRQAIAACKGNRE